MAGLWRTKKQGVENWLEPIDQEHIVSADAPVSMALERLRDLWRTASLLSALEASIPGDAREPGRDGR